MIDLETPHGIARAHLHRADHAKGLLVLGHGAGGGITARDLTTATEVALRRSFDVALVEQPYRVAGRRSPPPAAHLDAAWLSVIGQLRAGEDADLPLLVGGRSSGARVACRTAAAAGATAVLCLAFPLLPPRKDSTKAQSRLPELDAVGVPTLVVQGARDAFGVPPAGRNRVVVEVAADHALRTDLPSVAAAIDAWLAGR